MNIWSALWILKSLVGTAVPIKAPLRFHLFITITYKKPRLLLVNSTGTTMLSYSILLRLIITNNFGQDGVKQFAWLFGSLLFLPNHDDVIKWKHYPRYWPFVRRIHRSPVNSPHKGQWRGALMFSSICARINGWVNNGEAGDLRRHRVHYDVIVMWFASLSFQTETVDSVPVFRPSVTTTCTTVASADIRVATEFALMAKNQNHCTTFLHAFFEKAAW